MARIRKIIKDPLFIGAVVGLGVAIFWTVVVYIFNEARPDLPRFENAAKTLFFVTYPGTSFPFLFEYLTPRGVPADLIGYCSLYVWYIQYGFFSGLFFKILRSKYSRKTSAVLLALLILVFSILLYFINNFILGI